MVQLEDKKQGLKEKRTCQHEHFCFSTKNLKLLYCILWTIHGRPYADSQIKMKIDFLHRYGFQLRHSLAEMEYSTDTVFKVEIKRIWGVGGRGGRCVTQSSRHYAVVSLPTHGN